MRWLADECASAPLVERLRAAGHDVSYMAEAAPGTSDTAVLQRAHDEARVLLTEDKDFGDLVFRSRLAAPGIVLPRLDFENGPAKWLRLEAAIAEFGDRLLGRHVVIEARRFRSRPLLRSMS